MSTGNSLPLQKAGSCAAETREDKRGGPRHEEWIWFEHKTGPGGSLPAPATFPHTRPHSWDVHPPWNQQSLSQHPAQLQMSVSSPNLSLPMAAALGAAAEPHFLANSWRGSQTPGLDTSDFCVGACGRGRFINTCLTWTF